MPKLELIKCARGKWDIHLAMFLQTSTRSTPDNSSSSIIRNESEDIKKHEQIHFRHLLDSTNKWRFAFFDRIKCKTFFKLFLIKPEITCTILPPASQVRCIQKLTWNKQNIQLDLSPSTSFLLIKFYKNIINSLFLLSVKEFRRLLCYEK